MKKPLRKPAARLIGEIRIPLYAVEKMTFVTDSVPVFNPIADADMIKELGDLRKVTGRKMYLRVDLEAAEVQMEMWKKMKTRTSSVKRK